MDMQGYIKTRDLRNLVSAAVRRMRLLQSLDWVLFYYTKIRTFSSNKRFIKKNPEFKVPPPYLAYDAYNSICWNDYYHSGLNVANYLSELLNRHLNTQSIRVLEWGCGPARIIRHLPEILGNGAEVFGSDYNRDSISWCRENIKGVTFIENQLCPPLPLGNNSLDCVYGFSVLTHLSKEMCKAWIKELSRLTRSGGLILLSTKGEIQQARLLPQEKHKLLNNEPIFRGNIVEGKKFYDTILPTKYVKKELLSGLELILHVPARESASHHDQDIWILRNP